MSNAWFTGWLVKATACPNGSFAGSWVSVRLFLWTSVSFIPYVGENFLSILSVAFVAANFMRALHALFLAYTVRNYNDIVMTRMFDDMRLYICIKFESQIFLKRVMTDI